MLAIGATASVAVFLIRGIRAQERARGQRARQDALDEGARRVAAIGEDSDDAIVSMDLDGVITSWNPVAERIFGYRSDEAMSQPITFLVPPERLHEKEEIRGRLRRGERIYDSETVRRTKDGRLIDVSLSVSPIRSARGEIVGAAKTARDLWAPWCGPCRMIAPVLEELPAQMAGRVRFAKLNVDDNSSTAARFRVQDIPTLLVLKDGQEVDRIVGVQPRAEIVRRLERVAP